MIRCNITIENWVPMALPCQDHHFAVNSSYQAPLFLCAMTYQNKEDVALDIGAHVGFAARILGAKYKKVICFEPSRDLVPLLRRNAPYADIRDHALGKEKGRGQIVRPVPHNTGSGFVTKGDEFDIRRLDSCGIDTVDFMKIDVQGMEMDVLIGGEKLIMESKPVIVCEGKDDCEAEHWLRKRGAYICGRVGRDFIAGWNSFCRHGAFKGPI